MHYHYIVIDIYMVQISIQILDVCYSLILQHYLHLGMRLMKG